MFTGFDLLCIAARGGLLVITRRWLPLDTSQAFRKVFTTDIVYLFGYTHSLGNKEF